LKATDVDPLMSGTLSIVIRDALAEDVAACLALDHSFHTDHVWQMNLRQEDGWQIAFRNERLPRTLESHHQPHPDHLNTSLMAEQCFLVAEIRPTGAIAGYVVMRRDPTSEIGEIIECAVPTPFRRSGVGKRLIGITQNWAREHHLKRIQAAVRTINVPAIDFFQDVGFTFCGFNDHYFPNRDIALFFNQPIR